MKKLSKEERIKKTWNSEYYKIKFNSSINLCLLSVLFLGKKILGVPADIGKDCDYTTYYTTVRNLFRIYGSLISRIKEHSRFT